PRNDQNEENTARLQQMQREVPQIQSRNSVSFRIVRAPAIMPDTRATRFLHNKQETKKLYG
ncbi:MAG: hypothetical protein P8181_15020, partial [bacterium]